MLANVTSEQINKDYISDYRIRVAVATTILTCFAVVALWLINSSVKSASSKHMLDDKDNKKDKDKNEHNDDTADTELSTDAPKKLTKPKDYDARDDRAKSSDVTEPSVHNVDSAPSYLQTKDKKVKILKQTKSDINISTERKINIVDKDYIKKIIEDEMPSDDTADTVV